MSITMKAGTWGSHLSKKSSKDTNKVSYNFNAKLSQKLREKTSNNNDSFEENSMDKCNLSESLSAANIWSCSSSKDENTPNEFGSYNVLLSNKSFKTTAPISLTCHSEDAIARPQKPSRKGGNEFNRETSPINTEEIEMAMFEGTTLKVSATKNNIRRKNSLEGNFVKLNMKKKVYSKFKKSLTGSKYKRKLWKERQKQRLQLEDGETEFFPKQKTLKPQTKASRKGKKADKIPSCQKKFDSMECDDLDIQLMNNCEEIQATVMMDDDSFSSSDLRQAMKIFKIDCLKDFQETAIKRTLSNLSTLVIMPTGCGKSLCYQIPAYLYYWKCSSVTVVVTPLVSLMQDQIQSLPKALKAAALNSTMNYTEKLAIKEEVIKGNIGVLFLSPESIVGQGKKFLHDILQHRRINFACIDEVHCISTWAHNFRPSYLRVCKVLLQDLGIKVLLGLTATATKAVENDILMHFEFSQPVTVLRSPIINTNITISVIKCRNKFQDLVKLLEMSPCRSLSSFIVYCNRRNLCSDVASFIRSYFRDSVLYGDGSVEVYHAGLPLTKRRVVQKKFMKGKIKIVVATIAFGMGLHKSDLQCVMHFNAPNNYESFVQEIGRAGRNGDQSWSFLLMDGNGSELNEMERNIHCKSVSRSTVRKLLGIIFIPCKCNKINQEAHLECDNYCFGHERALPIDECTQSFDIGSEVLETLLSYIQAIEEGFSVLNPLHTRVIIQSYSGFKTIVGASKDCKPLAIAVALQKGDSESNKMVINIVEVASKLGWSCEECLRHFKILRSLSGSKDLVVEFENLSYLVECRGNKNEQDLEELLSRVISKIQTQEEYALKGINDFYKSMEGFADTIENIGSKSDLIKERLCEYFTAANVDCYERSKNPVVDEELRQAVKKFINVYSSSQNLTARSIAKIFHGIDSPMLPALYWSRNSYWRSYLKFNFRDIIDVANKEILQSRL